MPRLNARLSTPKAGRLDTNSVTLPGEPLVSLNAIYRHDTDNVKSPLVWGLTDPANAPRARGHIRQIHKLNWKTLASFKTNKNTRAKTPPQSSCRCRSSGELFPSRLDPTCATHRFDGNAPLVPFVSVRHPARENSSSGLTLRNTSLFLRRQDNAEIRCQVEETPATAESRLPGVSGRAAFLEVLTNFRDVSLGRFLSRWLGGNKSNPSPAPAAAVAVCGSCARRGPSSALGIVVFQSSGLQTHTWTHKHTTITSCCCCFNCIIFVYKLLHPLK